MDEIGNAEQIAAWLKRRAKIDPKIRRVIQNATVFEEMKASPAWQLLKEMAEGQKKTFFDRITTRLWQTPADPPSAAEIEYHKGFYQGCIWVIMHPEMAMTSLERAARSAWLMSHDGEDEAKEEAFS